jgi:hypothetical protein
MLKIEYGDRDGQLPLVEPWYYIHRFAAQVFRIFFDTLVGIWVKTKFCHYYCVEISSTYEERLDANWKKTSKNNQLKPKGWIMCKCFNYCSKNSWIQKIPRRSCK